MVDVNVDDAFEAVVEFENGAIGTIESSRFCPGRKNYQAIEINAAKGSIVFNLERLNELEVYWKGESPRETQGFHNVIVSEFIPSILGELVAARAYHWLGTHLCA